MLCVGGGGGGLGRAGRPEEGPSLSVSCDGGARWAQLGLSPPVTAQLSSGSGFFPRAGSCSGASSLAGQASSRRADEDGERELGSAGIHLASTRLGKHRRGTIGRACVGGSKVPAAAGTRPSAQAPWWFSWAGTSPRFWLSSRRRVSEREGRSSALSLHNPSPPGRPTMPGIGRSPTHSGPGGASIPGRGQGRSRQPQPRPPGS